jgi:hypothetical protein
MVARMTGWRHRVKGLDYKVLPTLGIPAAADAAAMSGPWVPPPDDRPAGASWPTPPAAGSPPPPAGWATGTPWAVPGWGPVGRARPTGTSIAPFVCTLGIYGFVYNYSVHDEMRRHSGRGIGGGVALLLTFLAGVAMPFVTAAEVGSLYARRGLPEPVRGWTGLWAVAPSAIGYVLFVIFVGAAGVFRVQTSPDATSPSLSTGTAAALGVGFLVYLGVLFAGGIVWFLRTNGALNRYWESVSG